jgi:glutamate N-acetyltransferase/amino-acid N-acetyltransferase
MVRETARQLKAPLNHVLVCSTGKIGIPLPIGRIVRGIPGAVRSLSEGRFVEAARAILTTDQGPKTAYFKGRIGGKTFHLAGFAKGAGMISPRLKQATMLAFFFTDLSVSRSCLSQVFQLCVDQTFNSITVDGDTSTNDTVLLMANGLAGNRPIQRGTSAAKLFEKALREVMRELALKIVEDGVGGTKCVRIEVKGAKNNREAELIARTIGNSPLVKTAFFGEDPNWGRILAAIGRAPATCDPNRTDLYYNGVRVVKKGVGTGVVQETRAKKVMKNRKFQVTVDLHLGEGRGCIWASDLTLDYVKLNSHYRT